MGNCMALMTVTGAKGSLVNFSQINCLLGQQELEGKRAPLMISGKFLPSFRANDPGARAGGFIGDRFLSGLQPQEFYFHCMAGREGLIDTAVKTSRSGYLQRCLIKNLESLKVHFDGSVRDDSDGNIVQFNYGDDGLDVTLTPYINHFGFIGRNIRRYKELFKTLKYKTRLFKNERLTEKISTESKTFTDYINNNYVCENVELSKSYEEALDIFIKNNPERIIKGKIGPHSVREYQKSLRTKYLISKCAAGEAVGVIAAQAIGEPSTQMTLNTFHMAGRGETNVTLGIPRL